MELEAIDMQANAKGGTLVIQPLPGIGDMIWFLPFIRAIAAKQSTGQVTVMTKPRSLADQIFKYEPSVKEVLWIERSKNHQGVMGMFRLAKLIKSYRFDQVYILHQSPRYAFVAWLAGIPHRFGYGVGMQRLWLNAGKFLPSHAVNDHPIDKAKLYLEQQPIAFEGDVPKIEASPIEVSKVSDTYQHLPKPWVAIGVGCSEKNRQWGIENFKILAEELVKTSSAHIFFIGGPADQAEISGVCYPQTKQFVPVVGRPLYEVTAILSCCEYFVGNDTGMLNLAAATGIPAIGMIGHPISGRILDAKRNIYGIFASKENMFKGMQYISVQDALKGIKHILLSRTSSANSNVT
jgi:heptosyltransferase II